MVHKPHNQAGERTKSRALINQSQHILDKQHQSHGVVLFWTKVMPQNEPYPAEIIAAIASAHGRAGVGIIRISGKNLLPLAQKISGGKTPIPRLATSSKFLAQDGRQIDSGLMIYFPAPYSFTGEDVLELQAHGGSMVLNMLLKRSLELGARLAEAGEFSLRAFLNNKIDLAQAEGIADLIEAGSSAAVKSAQRSLSGEFSAQITQLNNELVNLRMLVEASLDFPEEDLDFLQTADTKGKLQQLQTRLEQILDSARQGSILREGLRVVLIGEPNVGKSSLMNALSGEEIAIVTEIAGTTRDSLRQEINIDGVPIHIIDTAGLRDSSDKIEQIGISRTWKAIENADLALILQSSVQQNSQILKNLPQNLSRLLVINKIDLSGEVPRIEATQQQRKIYLSAKTGDGINLLQKELLRQSGYRGDEDGVFLARERHLSAISQANKYLAEANLAYQQSELLAESLRLAGQELSKITGEFLADDLLGEIFSRFCIGK